MVLQILSVGQDYASLEQMMDRLEDFYDSLPSRVKRWLNQL